MQHESNKHKNHSDELFAQCAHDNNIEHRKSIKVGMLAICFLIEGVSGIKPRVTHHPILNSPYLSQANTNKCAEICLQYAWASLFLGKHVNKGKTITYLQIILLWSQF